MDTHHLTGWLSPDEIQTPLRRMVGDDVCISGTWSAEQFKRGQGEGLGVWRVAGTMTTPTGEQQWSMVLKGWDCSDKPGPSSAYNWPWREAELYRSGVLDDLPGVLAPTCFGSVERDGSVWVWLEDLTRVPQPEWTIDHYAKAARHLGQFNGSYLAGTTLPVHRSLSQRWLDGWAATGVGAMTTLDDNLHHPFVRGMLPPDVRDSFFRIWSQRQAILDGLDAMPQTFCHLDAFHANIFFRLQEDDEEMVLIDWSFAGMAAVGEELVALCVAGVVFQPAMFGELDNIERVAFHAYIEGLQDAGWRGTEEDVWRAYRSAVILRYGPASLGRVLPVVMNEESCKAAANAMGVPFHRMQHHMTQLCRWVASHADDL